MATARSRVRHVARALGRTAGASLAVGSATGLYLYHTQAGVERAVRFWCHAGPVVAHYGWERFRAQDEADTQARYEKLHELHAPDILRTIEDLRGMFIKVGQVVSVRPEAVPEAIRVELKKLQDNAPPAKWEAVKMTLERDLGSPVEDLFEHIEEEPLGAASIGQAHLAHWNGQRVVVKVKYADADAMMQADFWCLESLFWLLGRKDTLAIVSMLRKQFEVELDYTQEAMNLRDAYEAFSSSPEFRDRVAVPKPIPELTSGNVIGMTYLPGPKLETVLRARLAALGVETKGRSFEDMLRSGQDQRLEGVETSGSPSTSLLQPSRSDESVAAPSWPSRCGRALVRIIGVDFLLLLLRSCVDAKLWLKARVRGSADAAAMTSDSIDLTASLQLLLDAHGFQLFFCPCFNGDPHPGNILLLPDGRIGLIDFGQCKRLSDHERIAFAELFTALAAAPAALDISEGGDERIASAFTALGVQTKNSQKRFLAMLPRLMFSRFLPDWFERGYLKEVFGSDRIEVLPTHVVMVYRASMLLRGLCLTMQRNVSVADVWGTWATRWVETQALSRSVSNM